MEEGPDDFEETGRRDGGWGETDDDVDEEESSQLPVRLSDVMSPSDEGFTVVLDCWLVMLSGKRGMPDRLKSSRSCRPGLDE